MRCNGTVCIARFATQPLLDATLILYVQPSSRSAALFGQHRAPRALLAVRGACQACHTEKGKRTTSLAPSGHKPYNTNVLVDADAQG